MTTLRLILGDQLNLKISSLSDCDKGSDIILICEIWNEATYVQHHKKKIVFIFSAMRHFAEELWAQDYNVYYTALDDDKNTGSFEGEVKRVIDKYNIDRIVITEASEYRVLENMKPWSCDFGVPVEIRPDDRFLCSHDEFQSWADGRKQLRMEYFYREMRKKHNILMDGGKPAGGEWNYDGENRKPPKEGLKVPQTYISEPDAITREVMSLRALSHAFRQRKTVKSKFLTTKHCINNAIKLKICSEN